MDDLPDLPARSGRGARTNPENEFEPLHIDLDPDALNDDELRQVDTKYLKDPAQSILSENESPDVPFRYSINPYRGCEHGCIYCLHGNTPILMGDGRTKPLQKVEVGDVIYGTERQGHYRYYARTRVQDHWSTLKPTYRITLADGTTLVASSDHRFLTDRGWKFVTGTEQGSNRRPHLTTNNQMRGVGGFERPPHFTDAYRRGYLCGMIRGDAYVGEYSYDRPGRNGDQWHFRLTLTDESALRRTATYLQQTGIQTHRFQFQEASQTSQAMAGIRTHARANVKAIQQMVEWPQSPSDDWTRGFLAGLFDAEGSYHDGVLRISNTDASILRHLEGGLSHFGFSVRWEKKNDGDPPVHYARLLGGLVEHLRFFHLVDPAIRRKTDLEGQAIKSSANLNVTEVEPLNEQMRLYDITTGTGDFIANGVVSHNCYARPTHEYLGFSAGLDFETRILVKENAPDLLAERFQSKNWTPEPIWLSGNTDPYQPVDRELKLTRRLLTVFAHHRNPVGIITKNGLLRRDLDVLGEMAAWDGARVTVSVTTLDNELAGAMEPRTARPPLRLHVIEKCAEAGVPVGVNVAPIVPGLTDEEVPRILEAAAERGATSAGYTVLRLPGAVKDLFVDWLDRHAPDRKSRVLTRLESLRGDDMNDTDFGVRMTGAGFWADSIDDLFTLACKKHGLTGPPERLNTDPFRRRPGGQVGLFEDSPSADA